MTIATSSILQEAVGPIIPQPNSGPIGIDPSGSHERHEALLAERAAQKNEAIDRLNGLLRRMTDNRNEAVRRLRVQREAIEDEREPTDAELHAMDRLYAVLERDEERTVSPAEREIIGPFQPISDGDISSLIGGGE